MPKDALLKVANTVHRTLISLSGGKVGWVAGNMPVLKLTTTGRKSGEQRQVMLTTPHQDGDTIVIVASKGGDSKHPAWYLNLVEDPNVRVEMNDLPDEARTARVATDAEHAELWPRIVADYSNYGDYQAKTDRTIPLIFLEPND